MCKREIASVSRYATTLKGCLCPSWHYRPHRRPCKHVAALLDAVSVFQEWEAANPGQKLMPEWTVEIKD